MISRLLPLCMLAISLLLFLGVSHIQASRTATVRYSECTKLSEKYPEQALDKANAWLQKNPASPFALHCQALALYGMKHYKDAAVELVALSKNTQMQPVLSANLLLQAADAYVLAKEPDVAISILSARLAVAALSSDAKAKLLVKRAQLYWNQKQAQKAQKDVSEALRLQPENLSAKSLLTEINKKN